MNRKAKYMWQLCAVVVLLAVLMICIKVYFRKKANEDIASIINTVLAVVAVGTQIVPLWHKVDELQEQVIIQIRSVNRLEQQLYVQVKNVNINTNIITTYIENVTKIEKEIADTKLLIKDLFDRTRIERFGLGGVSGNLISFVADENSRVDYLLLSNRPIPASVSVVVYRQDGWFPVHPNNVDLNWNCLSVRWASAMPITRSRFDYTVTYVIDPLSTNTYSLMRLETNVVDRRGEVWKGGLVLGDTVNSNRFCLFEGGTRKQ